MSTRVVEEIDDWKSEPFDGGYARLRELADEEFSGVVQAGTAKLCFLNGTAVGVLDGSVEDFEDASGTVYEAPSPALSLLALMQERSDEVRAKYYTEETPISEVDATLSDGGFSGYVELSENVLSGDYFVVYHAGRSMAVAYVGNSRQLLTDDEAFERADGEVGIYEVRPAEVEPVEIPQPEGTTPDAATGAAVGAADIDTDDGSAADTDTDDGSAADTDTDDGSAADTDTDDESAADTAAGNETESDDAATETDTSARETGERTVQTPATGDSESGASDDTAGRTGGTATASTGTEADTAGEGTATADHESGTRTSGHDSRSADTGVPDRLETRAVPSLDPARTASEQPDAGDSTVGAPVGGASSGEERPESGTGPDRDHGGSTGTAEPAGATGTTRDRGKQESQSETGAERDDLRAERDRLREDRDDLRDRLDRVETERDRLREERDDLEAEVEELEAEVERLRSQVGQFEDEYGAATEAEVRLNPAEALDETNLFVRYESKGEATLESAHDGNASREAVNGNLGLEYHTQFEADSASVADRSFEEFLHDTLQYRFVSWVVYDLLYEIRDTGTVQALQELYDAIPRVDRAQLNGSVTAEFTEDGQERRTQESFDVVLRDRMGNALVVANLNDSRQAATESMMNSLVTAASNVGESNDTLAAACIVTSSFFEPEALECAAEATSGGLLSRDKRESYVKLSRKRGYHLCLAEAREGKFHLAVPEL